MLVFGQIYVHSEARCIEGRDTACSGTGHVIQVTV